MTNDFTNSYALLIGIGDKGIEYSTDDAQLLYDVLTDEKLAGYPIENVTMLVREQATKENILKAFEDLRKKVDDESSIVLYYSGHGRRVADKTTNFGEDDYFLEPYGTHGASDFRKECIMAKDLKALINQLHAERLVFFFDCCHAQGMTKGDDLLDATSRIDTQLADQKIQQADSVEMVKAIDDEQAFVIISACKDHEKSIRWSDEPNSLFTKHLAHVLKGDHDVLFEDPYIRIMDVLTHIIEEVSNEARTWERSDRPFVNAQIDHNFPVSKVPEEKILRMEKNPLRLFKDKGALKRELKSFEQIVEDMSPNYESLDERGTRKLAGAYDGLGFYDYALTVAKNHSRLEDDSDLQRLLGSIYTSRYFSLYKIEDARSAMTHFSNAQKIAKKNKVKEDLFLGLINLAFMKLIVEEDYKAMRKYAKKARKIADKFQIDNLWKLGTLAEANLMLGKVKKAKKQYKKLAKMAGIIEKISFYHHAYHIYTHLMDTDNPEDDFLKSIEVNLLN
ncbi:MAG: caspase family protein [Bacteroidia bacterium]|nr:caspase family protein [Bacteroidia bacterium]